MGVLKIRILARLFMLADLPTAVMPQERNDRMLSGERPEADGSTDPAPVSEATCNVKRHITAPCNGESF